MNPIAQASTGWTEVQRRAYLEGWEAFANRCFTDRELDELAHKAMLDIVSGENIPEDRLYYRMGFIAGVNARSGN